MRLIDEQIKAVEKIKNGSVVKGTTGSGKSRVSIAYYVRVNGGGYKNGDTTPMRSPPLKLYIITDARKRDQCEWLPELILFDIDPDDVVIDSWQNIKKYVKIENCFFIFDEQCTTGSGVWARSFIRIAKHNQWIMLTATPGDCWKDYRSIFIAHGFYKDKTDFDSKHVVYRPFASYEQILRYTDTDILKKYRNDILVKLSVPRHTVRHPVEIVCDYNIQKYKATQRERFNYTTLVPIKNITELCMELRSIVNKDQSRINAVLTVKKMHPKLIIFYNYDYELEILKDLNYGPDTVIAEWNGHVHDQIPDNEDWVYLIQYIAGNKAWNCTETDAMLFYSMNYSYKTMEQSSGRIDRYNTPYTDLYYYCLVSKSSIDLSIRDALKHKKKFTESSFVSF